MDIEQIKIFCDLAETRSFSKAASRNLVSQSAVSQQIKNLESHLKLQLIDRTCRPLTITQAGEIFFDGCRDIFERYEELRNKLATLAHEITGSVNISGIPSVVLYLLQPYIRYYLQTHPNVKLYVEPMRANQAVEMILSDKSDIAMISSEKEDRRMLLKEFYKEKLLLAMHPKHKFSRKKAISMKDLQLQPVILFERDQYTRKLIDGILKRYGVTIKPVMELDNIETMKRGIEANVGLGILPEPAILPEISAGTIVAKPFSEELFYRPVVIAYRKGKVFSEPAKRFLALMKKSPDEIKELIRD